MLVNPGDDVVVENPGYQMGHRVFEAYGTNLHVVNVDDQVLVTDHLRLLIKIS